MAKCLTLSQVDGLYCDGTALHFGDMAHEAAIREPAETPLARALRGGRDGQRRTPVDAFALAHQWFLEGRRLDMRQLAAELGVGRATLYRWCGTRELLLGEIISSIVDQSLAAVWAKSHGIGAERLVATLAPLMRQVRTYEPLQRFVAEDAEYALRVLTSHHSVVQRRLIGWIASALREEVDLDPSVDPADLAYAIVRICESFVWSDMITGDPPKIDEGARMVGLLLSAATRAA